jgi:uncharacterized membrane protein
MITIETSIEIRRSVEAVFAYVSDFRNTPQWQGPIQEAHVTPEGPSTVGTKVTLVASFLGVKLEPTSQITALEPNRSPPHEGQLRSALGGEDLSVRGGGGSYLMPNL